MRTLILQLVVVVISFVLSGCTTTPHMAEPEKTITQADVHVDFY